MLIKYKHAITHIQQKQVVEINVVVFFHANYGELYLVFDVPS